MGKLDGQSSDRIMVLESDPTTEITEIEEESDNTPLLSTKKEVNKMLETRLEDIPSDNLKQLLRIKDNPVPSLHNQEFRFIDFVISALLR